jgi:hypothetical protein
MDEEDERVFEEFVENSIIRESNCMNWSCQIETPSNEHTGSNS